MKRPCELNVSSLIACALGVLLLATGCAGTTASIDFSKSELQRIPGSSLQRIATAHAADEVVAVRVAGHDGPLEVKEFKNRDSATVYAADGKEVHINFTDITELSIFRKPKTPEPAAPPKGASPSDIAFTALVYAPIVPVAIGTWPLLRAMGLDGSKNSEDEAKARLVYTGMSREDLLESVGKPREKYSCILKLNLKDRSDPPLEIWVYDDEKVLRGGRTLLIYLDRGTVSDNSFHTTFFKNNSHFACSELAVP